jgi:hypothetical protein
VCPPLLFASLTLKNIKLNTHTQKEIEEKRKGISQISEVSILTQMTSVVRPLPFQQLRDLQEKRCLFHYLFFLGEIKGCSHLGDLPSVSSPPEASVFTESLVLVRR